MDIFVIPPRANVELMDLGNSYFCLGQQYQKDENYRKFFKERVAQGQWVCLDNGLGDSETISQDELFDIMKDLMPSEVIPLDVLFDGDQTWLNALEFIERMKEEGLDKDIQILAAPQGNTFDEWLTCYVRLANNPDVHTIGMSKLAIPWVMSKSKGDINIARDRNKMFDYLKKEGLLRKDLHFLGAETPLEFEHYKNNPWVRSTDSCFSVFSAINGHNWEEGDFTRVPTPRDYFDRVMSVDQIELAQKNISWFKEYLW